MRDVNVEVDMRNETIAIHAGYEPDPTTRSVAASAAA